MGVCENFPYAYERMHAKAMEELVKVKAANTQEEIDAASRERSSRSSRITLLSRFSSRRLPEEARKTALRNSRSRLETVKTVETVETVGESSPQPQPPDSLPPPSAGGRPSEIESPR